ncbi:hypothetical protein HDU79_010508 [Rhizoclosmatium sp. JEL0117]|nr:hypothetical protein HDU79_010508 [Rhizoclosmatium sp. JEL0117]
MQAPEQVIFNDIQLEEGLPAPRRKEKKSEDPHSFETFFGWIRDRTDAMIIVEATIRGQLNPVLPYTQTSNSSVRSGSVVVFTQKSNDAHSIRWRDGRVWTTSKLSEGFLLYRESEPASKPNRGRETCGLYPAGTLRPGTKTIPDGMCKRTITITASDGNQYRVISYFYPKEIEGYFTGRPHSCALKMPSDMPEFDAIRRGLVKETSGRGVKRSPIQQTQPQKMSPLRQQIRMDVTPPMDSLTLTINTMQHHHHEVGAGSHFAGCICGGLRGMAPLSPRSFEFPVLLPPLMRRNDFLSTM